MYFIHYYLDKLKKENISCFGPSKDAAEIEWSKAFAKDFMIRHNIPTAKYKIVANVKDAELYIEKSQQSVVIKASGLASGKGSSFKICNAYMTIYY